MRGKLGLVLGAITVAFCVYLSQFPYRAGYTYPPLDIEALLRAGFIGLFVFAGHELGHAVASTMILRKQASFKFLPWAAGLSLFLSYIGIPFVVVGAVVTPTDANKEEMGRIALAGPLMNYAFAFGAGLAALVSEKLGYNPSAVWGEMIFPQVWFGLFNLVPIDPLDGKKVWDWKPSVDVFGFLAGVLMIQVIRW